jgi:Transposase DDE domain group 1
MRPDEMENRIKECQLDFYADRTYTATIRANQLRLWFASMASVLLCALRRIGLQGSDFAKATGGTIRLELLKIGAIVRVSVRRIKFAMAWAVRPPKTGAAPPSGSRSPPRPAPRPHDRAAAARTYAANPPSHRDQLFAAPAARKNPSLPSVFGRHGISRPQNRKQLLSQNSSIRRELCEISGLGLAL